jgi:hypothetical protein
VTLRFYLDENVDPLLARRLRDKGYDAISALEAGRSHQRIADEEQLAYAASEGRAIFSHDIKDYSPLAVAWAGSGREHAGIILSQWRPVGELVTRFRAFASRYPDGMSNICDYL